jgi:thioredoxin 1
MGTLRGKGPMSKKFSEIKMGTFPGELVEILDKEFDDVVKGYPVVLIDFWAPWCGPCRMLTPVIEEIAKDYKGKVFVAKMNTDENPGTPTKFGIMAIPTLLVFKGGELKEKVQGLVPKKNITLKIDQLL